MEKNLSIAYNVMKRNRRMAKGGMVNEKMDPTHEPKHTVGFPIKLAHGGMTRDPKAIAQKIVAKKFGMGDESYAEGGDVGRACSNKNCPSYGQSHPNCNCYAMGGEVDSVDVDDMGMDAAPDYSASDDFLTANEQDSPDVLTYPDPEGKEETEGMDPSADPVKLKRKRILSHIFSAVKAHQTGS